MADLSIYPASMLDTMNIMFNGEQCLPDTTYFLVPPMKWVGGSNFVVIGSEIPLGEPAGAASTGNVLLFAENHPQFPRVATLHCKDEYGVVKIIGPSSWGGRAP